MAKKISVSADGIDEAEKRANSADSFLLKILNGTEGSNPPLSAKQSPIQSISPNRSAKLARVREFPRSGGHRRDRDMDLFGPILRISLRGEMIRAPSAMPGPKTGHFRYSIVDRRR